jgi:hypothetical protein
MSSQLGRAKSVAPDALAVFRALIDRIVADGEVASIPALAAVTGLSEDAVTRAIDDLAAADWIVRDQAGQIIALYPFSPTPTDMLVEIDDATRHAMCAIDALGVAPLLGRKVSAIGGCPICRQPIRVAVAPTGITRRRPRSAVVIRRRTPGAAHLVRCAATRFACSPQHADQWLKTHGGPNDEMQSLEGAFIEARDLFSPVGTAPQAGPRPRAHG